MAKNKVASLEEALAKCHDGMTVMLSGFTNVGSPNKFCRAMADAGLKDLHIIANDAGNDKADGIGTLIVERRARSIVASHVGLNPKVAEQMNEGTLEVTLVPQGTLAERIRCGGTGLGGVLTPTGLGTPVGVGAEDASGTGNKESIVIDGKEYLLERPIRADIACIYGSVADKYGNVKIHGTARNFNTVMATAAGTVICQADEVVEMIDPDEVLIQGVLVDYIVGGKN